MAASRTYALLYTKFVEIFTGTHQLHVVQQNLFYYKRQFPKTGETKRTTTHDNGDTRHATLSNPNSGLIAVALSLPVQQKVKTNTDK